MATIIRGTTPTLKFKYNKVPTDTIIVANLYVKQLCHTPIEKTIDSAVVTPGFISWKLSQEETLRLNSGVSGIVVCDWKLSDGTRGRSKELNVSVEDPGKAKVI